MKYVKKPFVVEAFQFGVDEEPEWFASSYRPYYGTSNRNGELIWGGIQLKDKCPISNTRVAHEGDYIIKGIKGEIYPCKADIFWATYEPFDDPVYYRVSEVTNIIKNGTGDYTVYHKDSIERAKGTK